MAGRRIGLVLAVCAACVSGAAAEPARDWTVTVGVEGRVLPKYEGSSNAVLAPFPLFDVRPAGTPANFRSPREGFSVGVLDQQRFQVGPTVKMRFPRNEGSDSNLRGLGNVAPAVEAGAFAEYWPTDWLRGRVELRQGFGGHHGLVSDLIADVVVPVAPKLTLSGGPRLMLASSSATTPYFSISPTQSVASGLPVYDARGGVRSYGAGAQARYEWSKAWAMHFFVEYERLAGDAANAPLVTMRGTRDEVQVGFGVTYSFDTKALW